MLYTLDENTFRDNLQKLKNKDEDLKVAAIKWGDPPFWKHPQGFNSLLFNIISQLISLESAANIFFRLKSDLAVITPEVILNTPMEYLQKSGLSSPKIGAIKELALAVQLGTINFEELNRLSENEVRNKLQKIKGIGEWTSNSYLLFSLLRSDIWPAGDIALQKGIKEVKNLSKVQGRSESKRIAELWKPYRSTAARMIWHFYLSKRNRKAPIIDIS